MARGPTAADSYAHDERCTYRLHHRRHGPVRRRIPAAASVRRGRRLRHRSIRLPLRQQSLRVRTGRRRVSAAPPSRAPAQGRRRILRGTLLLRHGNRLLRRLRWSVRRVRRRRRQQLVVVGRRGRRRVAMELDAVGRRRTGATDAADAAPAAGACTVAGPGTGRFLRRRRRLPVRRTRLDAVSARSRFCRSNHLQQHGRRHLCSCSRGPIILQ